MRLELHPEARAELRSAALWYDEQRPGLGDEFIADVSATLDRIGGTPESYPAWPRTRAAGPLIRKATIQRFPYGSRSKSTSSTCSSWRSPTPSAGHSTGSRARTLESAIEKGGTDDRGRRNDVLEC